MEKRVEKKNRDSRASEILPQFAKPVWENVPMDCKECRYSDQDIDTFPCAKCHTRH